MTMLRVFATATLLGSTILHAQQPAPAANPDPVLARDIDKRPLPTVTIAQLPIPVRTAVLAIVKDQGKNFIDENQTRATPVKPTYKVQTIPTAVRGHHLYLVTLSGEFGCTGNGPNCRTAVLDQTDAAVATVEDDGFQGVAVIRRPNLGMPDIAFYEQEGHTSMTTTVYRFTDGKWARYACDEHDIVDFPPATVVAAKPCKQ